MFGKKTILERSFQASWFGRWTWLHYNEAEDCVHCFLCLKAVKLNHVAAKKNENPTSVDPTNQDYQQNSEEKWKFNQLFKLV